MWDCLISPKSDFIAWVLKKWETCSHWEQTYDMEGSTTNGANTTSLEASF